jgi:hypothetical protein
MILFYDAHGLAQALNWYREFASFSDTCRTTPKIVA